ncbi:MAG: hypothetical protein HDT00_00240 [Bacteroidales bacterium]|nr:hypothetical protein [Bacteroidales bacterium]
MSSEEIKKIAREYARYTCSEISEAQERVTDENIEYDFALPILKWLSKDYCIVEKSEVAKWRGIVEAALKEDGVITEPAFRFMWERLFEEEGGSNA